MIRAFIAIEIPGEIGTAVSAAQGRLRQERLGVKVSWAKTDHLHLTLQFLGNIGESAVGSIGAALELVAARHRPLALTIAGAGAFPTDHRPRVLWVGCADTGGRLAALAQDIHGVTEPLGFPAERRALAAHLTIGRIKAPRPDAALTRALDSIKKDCFGSLRAEVIHLFQSQLHPEGPIYTKLSSHTLRGDTDHDDKN